LDGAIRIPNLLSRAEGHKSPALAVTDHGNLFGAMEFYSEVKARGIKPIIGCEVYVAGGSRFEKRTDSGQEIANHLILLCENEKGYKNLCKLVSAGYLEGFYYKPRIDRELLERHNDGLVCLSACLAGQVASSILSGDYGRAKEHAAWHKEVFDDGRYYIELQENGLKEQKIANQGLEKIAGELDIPLVATNDCHYLDREDARAHEVLLCIQTGKMMSDDNRLRFQTDEFFFKSPEEMAHDFRDYPQAIKNTLEIADRLSLVLDFDNIHMPRFDPGPGQTLRERFDKEARDGFERRMEQVRSSRRVSSEEEQKYRERLDKEISLIKDMGFSGYFLIVADFIKFAKEAGIPVGPGRGSAAGSLAAYSLEITNIDPLNYNLLFERFLNPERKSMPDIDVDFCMEGRDRVIEYVSGKYGKENVAQIITFGRMQAKAVVRDVARVLGIPYAEADKIAKMIPDTLKITLDQALKDEPELVKAMERDPQIRDLINTAKPLEGLTRHASTHAAGIVISDKPLVERLPLYSGSQGETLTQYDMTWVEKIGLVKFDFLGLKTLTVIKHAVRMIREQGDGDFDLDNIPLDDKTTFQLLSRGETSGIFQLESSGMRDILTKLRPTVFEDLIALVALYRPGPLGSGMVEDFINRKHGRIPIKYPLPQLESILEETYGVILYQEQVMNIAAVLADYSLGEADLLRRAMGKKKAEVMAEQKSRFEKGCASNGIDPSKAEHIFDLVSQFAGYGFNKSHSAAYAMVAYQTAYLKTHHPVEFMTALLTSESGSTDKLTSYISECRDMGIEITPPHVNDSYLDFRVKDKKIVFGLGAVKNVGDSAIASILEARREDGPFCSIEDFCERVDLRKVNKKVLESLIKCGAFDGTGPTRRAMLDALDTVLDEASKVQKERASGQFNLFGAQCAPAGFSAGSGSRIKDLPEWDDQDKLRYEKDSLGFYITGHPLMKHEDIIKRFATTNSRTIAEVESGASVKIAGIFKSVKEHVTKKGDRMAFAVLEDLTGSVEVTIFPELYSLNRQLLAAFDPVMVSGQKDGDSENPKLVAKDICPIEESPKRFGSGLHIRISADGAKPDQVRRLKSIIAGYPGKMPLRIHVVIPHKSETIIGLPEYGCDPSEELISSLKATMGDRAVFFE
jgi:DNA polymerase-3 subunit alpha